MKIRSLIKNNKFFTIISVAFLVWFVFLVVLSIIGQRTVIFYDALGQADVSSDFSSKLPLMRYIRTFRSNCFYFRERIYMDVSFFDILSNSKGYLFIFKEKGQV